MLDSTAFDAKAYYEQLITTASLPVLLKKENDFLTGEIPHYLVGALSYVTGATRNT